MDIHVTANYRPSYAVTPQANERRGHGGDEWSQAHNARIEAHTERVRLDMALLRHYGVSPHRSGSAMLFDILCEKVDFNC